MNDNLTNFEPDPRNIGDPALDALLDEALSSEGIEPPAGMTDRIVAATMPLLASQPAVIGRIDSFSGSFVMRIAAGLMIAASVGVAIIASNLRNDAVTDEAARLAASTKQEKQDQFASLKTEIETAGNTLTAATLAMADTTIDHSLDQLSARADEVNAGVEQWSTVRDSLEEALNDMETEPDNG